MEEKYRTKYLHLLETYKARREARPLDGSADVDESYKWGIVSDCKGEKDLELVRKTLSDSRQNLMPWREKASLKDCLNKSRETLAPIIANLLHSQSPLEERLSLFSQSAQTLSVDGKSSFGSERTAAVLLTCYDPQNYCFFTPEVYDHLHCYLEDDGVKGSKYSYFRNRAKELASLITPEIRKVEDKLPQGSVKSDLLVAQDVFWEIFKNTPYILKNRVQRHIEKENDFVCTDQGTDYIWIGTKDKLIGNSECHYEFCWNGNKRAGHNYNTVFVEVHFEEKNCVLKNQYTTLLNDDPSIAKFPWTAGIKGIRLKDKGFNFVDYPNIDDLVEDAFNELKKLNEVVYPAVKQLKNIETMDQSISYYKELLLKTKNLVLTGAPGTGKTYLAKNIAASIIGCKPDEVDRIIQFGFVQFHPSYDYTDFVEGLRPKEGEDNNVGFELRDGIFKAFCEKALKNIADSEKSAKELGKEESALHALEAFLNEATDDETGDAKMFQTISKKSDFFVETYDDQRIYIVIPNNKRVKNLTIRRDDLMQALTSDKKLHNLQDVKDLFHEQNQRQQDSYILAIYKQIVGNKPINSSTVEKVGRKKFVFVIDEINRGDMSKIFGELFFSIDPGYRGIKGKVTTQYANMLTSGNAFDRYLNAADYGHFFVPSNVYIIGTMNDIDRSVESMDFAMRRRFAWKEVTAEESMAMLDTNHKLDSVMEEIKHRMLNLNHAIEEMNGLGRAYDIGAAYFMKYADYGNFDDLWQFHLEGVLSEYLRGERNAAEKLETLHKAYNNTNAPSTAKDDDNQG